MKLCNFTNKYDELTSRRNNDKILHYPNRDFVYDNKLVIYRRITLQMHQTNFLYNLRLRLIDEIH